jgi:hypothetical protein
MRHWTDDELIDSIYGIGPLDGHLDTCVECRGRRANIDLRRSGLETAPELPATVLAAQRRAVYARAERAMPGTGWIRAAFATAGVAALALTLMITRTPDRPVPVDTASVDTQLFADAWAAVASEEPRAAQPIHALFEEAP